MKQDKNIIKGDSIQYSKEKNNVTATGSTLSDLTFDKGTIGTDTKITSAVKGLDGNSVKYNDITYILSTRDISDSEYKKEAGVYKGKFVVTLPEGCTDYLVKLGDSYNGAESYFRVEE